MTEPYEYSRVYDSRTVALLFGLSGNRCAHPDCNNRIIAEPTGFDDAAVIGHIAHIYSRTSKGPRPFPGAKPPREVINGFDNLLLLCRHCHALIDGQENTYPPDEIKRWKLGHLAKHLRTRTSLLPEHHRRQSVLGIAFEVLTIDATLVEVGPAVVRSAIAHAPSGANMVSDTELRCWLQTDFGEDVALDLTNMQMPCPIGGRASLLVAVSEDGNKQFFSLLSHSTMTWHRRSNLNELYQALTGKRVNSPIARIGVLIVSLCAIAPMFIGMFERQWLLVYPRSRGWGSPRCIRESAPMGRGAEADKLTRLRNRVLTRPSGSLLCTGS